MSLSPLLHSQDIFRQFQGVADPTAGHIRPTADGGYILSGSFAAGGPNAGMLLMKTDDAYDIEWAQVLQSSADHLDYGIDALQTADGGYLVLGAYDTEIWKAPLLAKLDYCLVKTDALGQVQWAKRYGGGRTDVPYEVSETADGHFVITGYSSQGTSGLGNPQPFLLKVDSNGNIIWSRLQRAFPFNITAALLAHPSFQMKSIQTADGGTVYAISGGEHAWMVKLDANGTQLWAKRAPMGGGVMGGDAQALWGVAAAGGYVADLVELPNGNIALLGNVFYFIAVGNGNNGGGVYIPVAFITEVDSLGNPILAQAIFHPTGQNGNLTDLFASHFELLPNGNYLVGGSVGGYKAVMLEVDPTEQSVNMASPWARGFGWMHAAGYPYDYDIPNIGFSHNGDYLMWFDNLKLKEISAANPLGDPCSHHVTIQSFPFSPQFQPDTAKLDSILQTHTVAFQNTPLTVTDTALCLNATTSIFAVKTSQKLEFYPNPASHAVQVQIPKINGNGTSLEITDLNGRLIHTETLTGLPGSTYSLQLSSLAEGMYLLSVEQDQMRYTSKLLVRR